MGDQEPPRIRGQREALRACPDRDLGDDAPETDVHDLDPVACGGGNIDQVAVGIGHDAVRCGPDRDARGHGQCPHVDDGQRGRIVQRHVEPAPIPTRGERARLRAQSRPPRPALDVGVDDRDRSGLDVQRQHRAPSGAIRAPPLAVGGPVPGTRSSPPRSPIRGSRHWNPRIARRFGSRRGRTEWPREPSRRRRTSASRRRNMAGDARCRRRG